ncbi:MAG: flagellar biosynthetic protein FliR [Lachnospiraceae bacterium]|nr:flagellar biosynthetic protein FliR [Lachnospiraceae bacterium]
MDLTISTLTLEAFLLVVVRTGCFIATAPLFGHKSINARLRVLIGVCISLTIFSSMNIQLPVYASVLEYTFLVLKEAVVGLSLGFVASLSMSTIILAGEFIDREIGFTMSTNFDPSTGAMVTITAELYDKLIYLIIIITGLHHYILRAIAETFELIPVGSVSLNLPAVYISVVSFIVQYFTIGFRIAMPVFLAMVMLNVILGVLTKSSPQMNMFAIGMQLKVVIGMLTLTITIMFVPNIANYLVDRMQDMLSSLIGGL